MRVEVALPELGHDLQTGDVVSVLVREGDAVSYNSSIAEVETEKAVVEIPCPLTGRVVEVYITKGQQVKVGQPVLALDTEEPPPSTGESRRKMKSKEPGVGKSKKSKEEKGGASESSPGIPAQKGSREPAVPPGALDQDDFGPVRREPFSEMRQASAARLVRSVSTIPHVTNYDDADVTDLERMRKSVPPSYLGPAVKLTAMPFVLKSVALALRQHPVLNASFAEGSHEVIYKQYVNIGLPIDTPRGEMTPVLRQVDQMSVLQIARELTLLAARARSAEFKPEELQGATFTVNNLGATGGVYSTPIIRPPEAAALLVGRTRWLLGVHEGKIEGRLMMPFSLSYDNRLVDGTVAGRFLNDVIDYLQSPGKLLMTR